MGKGVHQPSDRPQTQKKLELVAAVFDVWLSVWLAPRQASARPLVVLDLFAGTGKSYGARGSVIDGSTLVLLNAISAHASQLRSQKRKVILRAVEAKPGNHRLLESRALEMLSTDTSLAGVIDFKPVRDSANSWVKSNLDGLSAVGNAPAFVFMDPDGLQIDKATVDALMALPCRTDFFVNYMAEGVARVAGAAASSCATANGNRVKMVKFLGEAANDTAFFNARVYADGVFTPAGYYSVTYPIQHPQKARIQYIMIYASKSETVVKKVMRDVLANAAKETYGQSSLFDVATRKALMPTMGPEEASGS